jgi:regulator of CtrA degradation
MDSEHGRAVSAERRCDGPDRAVTRLLDEAVGLAVETRDYLREARGEAGGTPELAMRWSLEVTRISTRIGECIAWLLARRAVQAGELDAREARAEPWRLGAPAVCLGGDADGLPTRLRELGARSGELYRRIARLDALLDAEGPATLH